MSSIGGNWKTVCYGIIFSFALTLNFAIFCLDLQGHQELKFGFREGEEPMSGNTLSRMMQLKITVD